MPDQLLAQPPPARSGPKYDWARGDTCWIYCGLSENDNPILSEGRVLTWLDLPDHATRYYVIQLSNPDWMVLEIRDALLMTDDPKQGLPFQKTRHFGLTELAPKRRTTHA